jgi:hypothetical protein
VTQEQAERVKWAMGVAEFESLITPKELKDLEQIVDSCVNQCCSRDRDFDGNCDRHPKGLLE